MNLKKLLLVLPLPALAATVVEVPFDEAKTANYEGRTEVCVAGNGFDVSRTARETGCSAWSAVSDQMAIPPSAASWSLDFEIRADRDWYRVETSANWMNAVKFFDANGSELAKQDLEIEFPAKRTTPFRFTGSLPERARFATVQFGIDSNPPVRAGEGVSVRKVVFSTYARGEKVPEWVAPDIHPPLVWSEVASPTTNENVEVRYRIEDETGVDWSSVSVTNEATGVAVPFERDGEKIVLRPGCPWQSGVTRLAVAATDTLGQSVVAHKVFLVGEEAKAPRIRLRQDGIALLDGKPWFPVGIYAVERCEFNGFSYEKAFADLRAAGLDLGHSYRDWRSDDLYDGAAAAGAHLFVNGKPAAKGDEWFMSVRDRSAIVLWYIGDDTSMNTTPQELLDREEACRLLDGTRLTCHADGVGARRAKSNLRDYVDFVDVFMPEIYPFDGHDDEQCVAEVCRDMDRCFSDYARFGKTTRPRAVWPILQCFDGASWKRYPTAQEMYATSFAALVHGAQGITWFKYGGAKDETRRYSGMFRTPEDWTAMTNITRRIAALAPVLRAETPTRRPAAEVVEGPRQDPLGQPAVTAMAKELDEALYVIAVNASPSPVRARIPLGVRVKTGRVAWEARSVKLKRGTLEDSFDAFGVHVYRIIE